MSNYYTVLRKSRTFSGEEEFKTLFSALLYIHRFIKNGKSRSGSPCEYTFTLRERHGFELVEKAELKRLKKKYEAQS